MRANILRAMIVLIGLVFAVLSTTGCASTAEYSYSPPPERTPAASSHSYAEQTVVEEAEVVMASAPPERRRFFGRSDDSGQGQQPRRGEQAAQQEATPMEATPIDGDLVRPDGSREDGVAEELEQEELKRGQLLIYTGQITLAIYDVRSTQEKAVALVEEMDGYISQRTSNQVIARIPAASFRTALEEMAALGDVLDMNWEAQDVSEEVRDLDIRLRNALQLRDRLESLLERVESVEDALKIEEQLERITLEVERIRGQLLSFEDRIAYSTIVLSFRPKSVVQVPDDDFLLPFPWLHQLGLETLLKAPEGRR